METQKLNPTTPGTRHQIILLKNLLTRNQNKIKNLQKYYHRKKGRSLGRISVRHKGSGHKKVYRIINYGNFFSKFLVISNYLDPYRNSFISLVFDFIERRFDFILAPSRITSGSVLIFNMGNLALTLKLGDRTLIQNIPAGSFIYNVSLKLTKKATYVRSAGTFGQIIQKTNLNSRIRLPSGTILTVRNSAAANLGSVSNLKHKSLIIGKAGRNRLLGIRPSVRGIAMNPVDHPHGGRTKGGMKTSRTPWGKPTRGAPTVKKK